MSTNPAEPGGERVVDTRTAGHASCVDLASQTLDTIAGGESFVLLADHDPVGLRLMFAAERPDGVRWEAVEDGPPLWRARLTKTPGSHD